MALLEDHDEKWMGVVVGGLLRLDAGLKGGKPT
jgi:hypothetical protein